MTQNTGWIRWSVKWKDRLQGESGDLPLFSTKRECQAFIKDKYGYIATRKDLRSPPHNWRMPKPVKVIISELEPT